MSVCCNCDHNACPGDSRCCVLGRVQVHTKNGVRSKYALCPDFVAALRVEHQPRNQAPRNQAGEVDDVW